MGNCFTSNKILAHHHQSYAEPKVEHVIKASSSSKQSMKKVRFKSQNDIIEEGDHRGSCGVRIRIVMTQEELKKMLSYKDDAQHTSLEQLLGAFKLRGGGISEVGEYNEYINSWRPALESIPEDRLMK
ncbi:hypothetical protein RJT34_31117 [Clitoria ternatea]|uniref:Uncharacterized protein n=1 Tax=Clitoria ternatea TaxID=43366 RepID=A0AAN9EUF6_CLITE